MADTPYFITAEELVKREKKKDTGGSGMKNIPPELVSNTHLIYSSPATLAFHSPGAEGFGVKRAGLAIPDSIMLLVAPGCCGRNTSALSTLGTDRERFFYLLMDETDIVTGRHLKKIPQAVQEICEIQKKMPSVVMICITCVDALLGTDMERVCRKAEELVQIPVRPCYMYALTREGRKPPMVHVRQSLYSLLEKKAAKEISVNLLGYFAPLIDECELPQILGQLGVEKTREISTCRDYEEYLRMGEASFNLVLNPEARFAAQDMNQRIAIPYAELFRLYQLDKIQNQYHLFAKALGGKISDQDWYDKTSQQIQKFCSKYPELKVSIGGTLNANAFELAVALIRYGFQVKEIFANLGEEDYVYLRKIAELSPDTRIYSNLEPTMLYYDCSSEDVDLTIGKDAKWYHPDKPNLPWNQDKQPFGYGGLQLLFTQLTRLLEENHH